MDVTEREPKRNQCGKLARCDRKVQSQKTWVPVLTPLNWPVTLGKHHGLCSQENRVTQSFVGRRFLGEHSQDQHLQGMKKAGPERGGS